MLHLDAIQRACMTSKSLALQATAALKKGAKSAKLGATTHYLGSIGSNMKFATAVLLATCLWSSPIFAKLTVQQVWDGMRSAMSAGGAIEAEVNRTLNGLAISGFTKTMPNGQQAKILSTLTLIENSDGSVAIDLSEGVVFQTILGTGDARFLSLKPNESVLVITGDPGDFRVQLSAGELEFAGGAGDGMSPKPEDSTLLVPGVFGSVGVKTEDRYIVDARMSLSSLQLTNPPGKDAPDAAPYILGAEKINTNLRAKIPLNTKLDYLLPLFEPETEISFSMSHGFAGDAGGAQQGNLPTGFGTTKQGNYSMRVNEGRGRIEIRNSGITGPVEIAFGGRPIEGLSLTGDNLGLIVDMPMKGAKTGVATGFELRLDGLAFNDAFWDTFDKGRALDRAPASLLVGGSTVGRFGVFELFAVPSEQRQLLLANFVKIARFSPSSISLLGAKLNGSGQFNVEVANAGQEDKSAIVGKSDLELEGGFHLLTQLEAIGVLAKEQIGLGRTILEAFTTRDGDKDKVTTTLEINETGEMSLNGKRVR
jgi:hypothetical protein